MTSLAATERTQLSALAQQLGPDAPTLCEGWKVRDLVVHLLVREGSLTGLATAVPAAGALARLTGGRRGETDFIDLVTALRNGPPLLSPFSVPVLGTAMNTVEYFVHHEDVRRAQPDWAPRTLPRATEDKLWRALKIAGRVLTMRSPVAVQVRRSDTGDTARVHGGGDGVLLTGQPSELLLHLFGRGEHALVELEGDPADLSAFAGAKLGL